MKRNLSNHLQLRMLRAIVAIAEQRSLLKAAGLLGVTQPSLTRTLRDTEAILGALVFERHPRGMHLTPFGCVVYEGARKVLGQVDQLGDDLERHFSGHSDVVTIGAMAPAAIGVLPGFASHLHTHAPDLRICVNQGTAEELVPRLVGGELSLILGRLFPPTLADRFVQNELYCEPVSVLARSQHPIFSAKRITLESLCKYDFILPSMSQFVEQEFEALLLEMGMRVSAGRRSSLPFLRELLHSSDNLTLSPPQTMGGDIDRGTIRVVPFDLPLPPRPAGLIFMQRHRASKMEQRVVALLTEYLHGRTHHASAPYSWVAAFPS